MKLTASIRRSLQTDMRAELRDLERAAAVGTREAGGGLKTELRRQVTGAGLGQRLARSWRDRHYDDRGIDAASLVYTKAPQLIRTFDEGAVIRSRSGLWPAIPTPNAPRRGIGPLRHIDRRSRAKAGAQPPLGISIRIGSPPRAVR